MAFERNLVRLAPSESAYEGAPDDGRYNSMLSCLVYIARLQGLFLSEQQLVLDNQLAADRVAPQELAFIAQRAGMRARVIRPSVDDLLSLRRACPAIVTLRSGGAMVVTKIGRADDSSMTSVEVVDPDAGPEAAVRLDIARFQAGWTGDLVLVKREFNIRDENQPFGIRFIASQLLREGKLARDIVICALFMSALALVPLFYLRLMIADVLYYNALNTFWLLVFLLIWAFAFTGTFSFIRNYLVSVVTVRVDARMNEYVYDKLLTLPIDYFERTPVGEISHKVHELVKVRDFIGRSLFGTVLDASVLLFFIPVMFYMSWIMTCIVLASVILMMGVIIMMLPALRAAAGRLIQARVKRGTALYQTLAGIRTVKSLALEARQRANWDVLTADVARKDYEQQSISNFLKAAVFPLEQMAMYGSFTVGAYLVLTGSDPMLLPYLLIYVMFSHRVISPFIQLAQLVEQYDEVRITIEIINEVVNRPPEDSAGDHGIRKPLQGHVEFSGLRFKYAGSQAYALDDISFEVPVGTTIGLVGRSGSGKTTVTRLLQRLHSEYDGLIKVDGVDVREYDLAHLRRSLGVVLQENFLFSGTIRENVVAAKPSASFDEVVNACRLAGAEEFIERLPRGYDTYIFEGSPNLSGGQRQRLAIARALIVDPRILILDEATSALDPDSEAIVNDNIRRIAEGRTMLVISHRLSSLVNSDAILVLERGKVVDLAPHAVLLDRCEIYRNLWNQQNRHSMAAARQTVRGPSRVS